MTGVANVNFQQNVPNLKVINFKAGENDRTQYRPQSQAPVITRPPMNDQIMLQRMIQEQQKQEKKQKLKQNLSWGIGIASGLAIITMVLAQFKGMSGMGDAKTKEFKELVKCIKNTGIKREAEEELARQAYERSLYRVQDLITLDKLAQVVEERKPADITEVKKYMDSEIIGMDEAKEKIYDFLKGINYDILNGITSEKPIVLCLDGPPGTGKSSLMKTIADSLGMYFKKISLSGAKNGEMITGFERTYAGATPGVIAKAQLEGNTKRVLYGFDEAEKAAGDSVLDVLLPILDNQRIFTDKYYNANVDLSQSMFVLTTNEFYRLPEAIRNRVQKIDIGAYSNDVKAQIAKTKLSKELKKFKLENKVKINNDTYDAIASLTTDKGGRQTTIIVDNLIEKLKGMVVDGNNNIDVNKNLINSLNIKVKN